jgi:hypothetical protein
MFKCHEVDDQSDCDPKKKERENVDAGNDQPESKEPGSTRPFTQNDDDVGEYYGNDPIDLINKNLYEFLIK